MTSSLVTDTKVLENSSGHKRGVCINISNIFFYNSDKFYSLLRRRNVLVLLQNKDKKVPFLICLYRERGNSFFHLVNT